MNLKYVKLERDDPSKVIKKVKEIHEGVKSHNIVVIGINDERMRVILT